MPLSEFLRLAREKLQSDQRKQFPTDLTSRAESGVVELVCENGQIMKQGQSNRITRNPDRSSAARVCDAAGASRARIEKSGGVEPISNDILSGDCVLGQDEEMVAWLNNINNPIDDALLRYCSGVLPEISGVPANGTSNHNSSTNKRGSFDQSSCNVHSNIGNGLKDSSSKSRPFCSWIHQQGTATNPSLGSGVSDVISNNNNTSNHPKAGNGSSVEHTVNDSTTSIKVASKSSNFSNFSRLSRQATNLTPNLASSNGVRTPISTDLERMEVKEKDSTFVAGNPVKSSPSDCINTTKNGAESIFPSGDCAIVRSRQEMAKVPKDSFPERTAELCQQNSIKNNNTCRGVQDSEGTVEPEVASSSVGSGYSADRMSYERTHNSKRKYYDIEESECHHGDDIGTEFGGVRKTTRGGTGSKRGRAAEVHNLSERRRRDRINEKMRALQELIPNCNKVDKASMLDEAIEYLRTLQLQVQIMSMGTSLCMPQMMFPTAFQQMSRAQMPHYNPPFGMSIGMGSGMGMVDMNRPVPPMHGAHFPSHMSVPVNFQGLSINPLVPLTGQPPITPTAHSGNLVTVNNSQLMHNAGTSTSINHRSSYQMHTTNDVKDQSVTFEVNKQATDVLASAALTSTKATGISKVDGQV